MPAKETIRQFELLARHDPGGRGLASSDAESHLYSAAANLLDAERVILVTGFCIRAAMIGEVGVHPGRVGLVVRPGRRGEGLDLPLGDAPPAERPQEGVGGHLRLPEQLGEPPARQVPPEVHLPEPVLRLHVPLRIEEIVRRVGEDEKLFGNRCGKIAQPVAQATDQQIAAIHEHAVARVTATPEAAKRDNSIRGLP